MATHQLVVKSRSTGYQAPAPEIVVAPFDYAFNANLSTPAGTTLATGSTRALRASGAALDDLYELRYHPSGVTAAVCTVRDMLRESAAVVPA